MSRAFKSERHVALSQAFPGDETEARHKRHRAEVLDITTRRHPRTMAEAFPDERAPALQVPRRRPPLLTKSVGVAVLLLIAVAVVISR